MFDVNSLGGKLIDNQNLKKALESGGGDSGFTVTFTVNTILYDAEYGSTFDATCDKTTEEIISAISSGEKINVKITSLDYDESQITRYYTVLSNYAYPQDGEYGIATLADSNKVVGFYFADGAIHCSVYQYAEVPISYTVYTTGGVAKVNNVIFTGSQALDAFVSNKMMTFQIISNFYRPMSLAYVSVQQKATMDFSIGGVIKQYTLDASGNFAEVV